MNLRIRYDDRYQTIKLDTETTEKLWVSLGIEDEGYSQEEKEELMQQRVEEKYNIPEYNSYHKFWRHYGDSKAAVDEEGEASDSDEPLMSEVADDRIFRKDEIKREETEADEAICAWIRKVLYKKPEVAEAFIATKYGDTSIRGYAAKLAGPDATPDDIRKLENSLSKKLTRAAQVLAKAYPNRDF